MLATNIFFIIMLFQLDIEFLIYESRYTCVACGLSDLTVYTNCYHYIESVCGRSQICSIPSRINAKFNFFAVIRLFN